MFGHAAADTDLSTSAAADPPIVPHENTADVDAAADVRPFLGYPLNLVLVKKNKLIFHFTTPSK